MKKSQQKPRPGPVRAKRKELRSYIAQHRPTFIVYIVLRVLVITTMVVAVLQGNYENLYYCTLTLILFLLPAFVEKNLGISLPSVMEIIVLFFAFSAPFLGEMAKFYIKIPFWDTMLHTMNGFLCAAFGFALVDIFNRSERFSVKMSPLYLAIVAFCFSMTVGVLWEFFEFFVDMFLHTDMQKDTVVTAIYSTMLDPNQANVAYPVRNITSTIVNGELLPIEGYLDIGLIDTMKDLFVNFIGAVIFSVIGFFYVKNRGKNSIARNFIPEVVDFPEKTEKSPDAPGQS